MRADDQPVECFLDRHILSLSRTTVLYLDGSGGNPARPDNELIGKADQIHRGKFCAWRLVAIVV